MAVAWVKSVGTNFSASAASVAVTVPAAGVAAGNIVVVRAGNDGAAVTISSMVDSKSNTYTQLHFTTTGITAVIYVGNITSALVSGDTITITWGAADGCSISVDEFSGCSATEDGTSAGANGTSTTPTATMTPATVGLIVGAVQVDAGASDAYTEDADVTNGSWVTLTTPGSTGTAAKLRGGYKILSATGAQTYNPTLGTSRIWAEALAALQPAAAVVAGRSTVVTAPNLAVCRASVW